MTFVLLDDNRDEDGGAWLFEAPYAVVTAHDPDEVTAALEQIEAAPFAAGFFSYELGYALEPRLLKHFPENRDVPLLWFGLFYARRHLKKEEVTKWLEARGLGHEDTSALDPDLDVDEYLKRFDKAKEYIAAGDVYQINLTFKSWFEFKGNATALYRTLRERQPVSYGAFIDAPEFKILSLSPELFIKQQGQVIETKPMKGTAPLTQSPQQLADDKKSQAENLMIVDLMRNDFGRIAEMGSVKVSNLFHVDTYKTLHQMVSTVTAQAKEKLSLAELLKAVFPPGSVTGTPKIRAMEIIRELESAPRGVYTGAIGMIARGEKLLNVAIRTAVIFPDGRGELSIGSEVVYDSSGEREYEECLLKTRFFANFSLIETLRYDGEYVLLDRHLARLKASAGHFHFKYDEQNIRDALAQHVVGQQAILRVRLTLNKNGEVEVTSDVLQDKKIFRYVIHDRPIHSNNLTLYHKTTQRDFLDAPLKDIQKTVACDEIIYLNERGELTQGSYTNLFLDHGDGVLLTPPLSAGLLPGTLRAELLETGRATEKSLFPDDLAQAKAVYLGNSVRGLVRAEIIVENQKKIP